MKKLLCVCPYFPPTSAADVHRIRVSLPFFANFGWEPTVLALDPAEADRIREEDLLDTLPATVKIVRVGAVPKSFTKYFGLNNAGLRSLPYLFAAGNRLLSQSRFDLIYFSTTVFPAMALGRLWKARHSVPYAVDMQDPWVTDYYSRRPKSERLPKYWAIEPIHKVLEAWTMKKVSGVVAVSESYHRDLCARYPNISPVSCATIPFGAAEADFAVANERASESDPLLAELADRVHIHGVYTGVLGTVMQRSCRIICGALKKGLQENPQLFGKLRLHFIGTSYGQGAASQHTIAPIAKEYGVENFISEHPARIPYLRVLRTLQAADFLLVPGTDDPGYTASKLLPYVLAKKPLLALFHEGSSGASMVRKLSAGELVTFGPSIADDETVSNLASQWAKMLSALPFSPATDWEAFREYTAEETTRRQCQLFDRIVAPQAAAATAFAFDNR